MSISLDSIIPLGRRYHEYRLMFNLNNLKQNIKILDCGGGPSSFNYEISQQDISITSIDPIYQFTTTEISSRIDDTFEDIMTQLESNRDNYIWSHFTDVQDVRTARKTAMEIFLNDYTNGKTEKRYIHAELPNLPFENNKFDLALSSHFLFLYSENLTYEFHVKAIDEMLRVANEVRIFPIVDLNSEKSKYLNNIIKDFTIQGYKIELIKTDYEFQKSTNEVLIIKR